MENPLLAEPARYQIYRWFWKTVDFVYPPNCTGCGKSGEIWCQTCQNSVHPIDGPLCRLCGYPSARNEVCSDCQKSPPPYSALRSWAEFEGPLREALHNLKYHSDLAMGNVFAPFLIHIILSCQWDFDFIIPMPISKQHYSSRGFNQSVIISRPIALALNKPMVNNAVERIKETKSQVNLDRDERFKNLQSAFLGNSAKLLNKKVLLVDDISTTGATMISCSQSLKDAGCSQVYCLTVARTKKTNDQ